MGYTPADPMIREHIFSSRTPTDPQFRWRGGNVSRIEGLSDAAFAFALTMMVVDSFSDVKKLEHISSALREIPALIACFAILIWFWSIHHRFFRRFGLEDDYTIFLNSVLLLTVMIYVYPLKLLFTALFGMFIGGPGFPPEEMTVDGGFILRVYGLGFVLIFLLFALMVRHAYRQRERLELDEVEIYLTKSSFYNHLLSASIGVFSIAMTFWGPIVMNYQIAMVAAGMSYALNGPLHWWHGVRTANGAEAIEKRLQAAAD